MAAASASTRISKGSFRRHGPISPPRVPCRFLSDRADLPVIFHCGHSRTNLSSRRLETSGCRLCETLPTDRTRYRAIPRSSILSKGQPTTDSGIRTSLTKTFTRSQRDDLITWTKLRPRHDGNVADERTNREGEELAPRKKKETIGRW